MRPGRGGAGGRSPRPSGGPGADGNGLTRREYCGLAAGGLASALAGCGGNGDDSTASPGARADAGVVSLAAAGVPSRTQLNPYALQQSGEELLSFFQQLVLPVEATTGRLLASGHAWSIDDEAVSVPCLIADYELDAPESVLLRFDDRFTYWNGEPLDARAYALHDRIQWLSAYGRVDGTSQPDELVGDAEYRRGLPADRERNRFQARSEVHPGRPPLPPSFTEPWVERLEEASTAEAVDDVVADLARVEVDLRTYAEESYGTGAYEIRSPEDVGGQVVRGHRREDHPSRASIRTLELRGYEPGSVSLSGVAGSGALDLGTGVVSDRGGDVNRSSLPDRIEQLATYLSPRRPGYQLVFNWGDGQLRRLWVRRALVAVVPFDEVVANGWGDRGRPPSRHSGMLSRADERALGRSFVDDLHRYPVEGDVETARDWLREAGYREVGGQWQAPDGDLLELSLVVPARPPFQVVAGTVERALGAFGVPVRTRPVTPSTYRDRIEDGRFHLTVGRSPGGFSPVDVYAQSPLVARDVYVGPPTAVAGNHLGTCGDGSGVASVPGEVTLPAEPGALRVAGASDDDGSTYRFPDADGEPVNVCERARRLAAPDVDGEAFLAAARACARWYNYAVPNFVFVQTRTGAWGDRSSYDLPPVDHGVYRAQPFGTARPDQYLLQAGLVG